MTACAPPHELVRTAKRGDVDAFTCMLMPLYPVAFRLAYGLLHDRAEAEDAIQEAALKAWRKLANLRDGTEMRPWFLAIVANQCRTLTRSRWWSVIKVPDLPGAKAARIADGESEVGMELRSALKRLSHDQRLVLVLRYHLDLPYDVALLLRISPKAARSRVERALGRLRALLAEQEIAQ